MKTYAVLHTHDTFGSVGDAILKVSDYVNKAEELGIKNLALTNHGSMSTFVNFYEECKEKNINPIIGCEVYFCNDRTIHDKEHRNYHHLILLAKNYNGLKNLLKIHNDSQDIGFYYKPRTDWSMLEKHNKDIICLTACLASPLGEPLLNNNKEKAREILLKLKSIFKEDLYLEIQPGNFDEQIKYNNELVDLSKETSIKLVATNDIHYLNKDDYIIHDYHVKDARKLDMDANAIYPDKVYYLMSREELKDSFKNLNQDLIEEALDNTLEIALKCNIELPNKNVMPQYLSTVNEDILLQNLCVKNLDTFFNSNKTELNKSEYITRLGFELATIQALGFSGYFLIVKDIIDFCDNNNIARGPGRGSGAGSLVSFLLNISIADPIKYNLMFERFLSVKRKSIPDIDLDLSSDEKEKVYAHLKEKYGTDHCCFIRTYGIRKARNAVKAACRILKIDATTSNNISKTIPYVYYDNEGDKHSEVSIQDALNNVPEFKEQAKKYPKIIDLAKKIEGYPSSTGIHPAGVVICPFNITDRYPLVPCKNDYFMATSLDLHDVEKLSGVKFDLLSLSSLSAINNTIKNVNIKFNYADDKFLNDKKVWKLIGSSNTCGLFQISSNVYKNRMSKLHPKSIQELAACLALVRGPCIASGADKKYINILNKVEEPEKLHEIYWNVTKDTLGVLIYQEQILKICINIGFDSETAYKILKAVSKKKIDQIKKYEAMFYELGYQKNIDKNIIDKIWAEILNSGLYAFNIAHATSYALLCYSSAYLMTYYPIEYLCNLLQKYYSNRPATNDVLLDIIDTCKKRNIKILPPNFNSSWEFKVEGKNIRAGFSSIKGIGENCYNEIRKNKKCNSLKSFIDNVSGRLVNKRNVLILIMAGLFRNVEKYSDKELAEYYINEIRKEKAWDSKIKIGGNISIDINKDKEKSIVRKLYDAELF